MKTVNVKLAGRYLTIEIKLRPDGSLPEMDHVQVKDKIHTAQKRVRRADSAWTSRSWRRSK